MSDLISRSALLAKMKQTSRYFAVKFDIEEAPAVDAVPVVHGRWLRILRGNYECSVCGCIPYYASNVRTLNYCPNCGAKMDGGQENGTE